MLEYLLSSVSTELIFLVTVLLAYVLWYQQSLHGLPPFPARPIPILGNALNISVVQDLFQQFRTWRKQLGDIFSFYLGQQLYIVINGYDAMKEAVVTNSSVTSDRPPLPHRKREDQNRGIGLASGPEWKERRSLFLHYLKGLSRGANVFEEYSKEEILSLFHILEKQNGQAVDFGEAITRSMTSLNASFLLGQRFDDGGKTVDELITVQHNAKLQVGTLTLLQMFPFLKYLPSRLSNVMQLHKSDEEAYKLADNLAKSAMNNTDEKSSSSLTAAYYEAIEKKEGSGRGTVLSEKDLRFVLMEIFIAGADTIITSLEWWVIFMCNFPSVQEKAFEIIKDQIGLERLPTVDDKPILPYINAMVLETLRMSSITPLSFPHESREDFKLRGYTIPKGAILVLNLNSITHDESMWGNDVHTFKPERFIDSQGNLCQGELFIPFSVGKRSCPGESYARAVLFIFMSSILQRFQIVPIDSETQPTMEADFNGFLRFPKSFHVRFVERTQTTCTE